MLGFSAWTAGAPTSQADKQDPATWESEQPPERGQHFPPCAISLRIAHLSVLDSERVNLETVPRYPLLNVMEMSSDPSGPARSLRPEAASSLATINSKQMGKLCSLL